MRKLMWFSIGFALACIAGAYLVSGAWLWILALFCTIGILGIFFLRSMNAKRAVAVLLGCAVGFLWCYAYDGLYLQTAKAYDGTVQLLEIQATDYSFDSQYGIIVDGKTELEGKSYDVRVYLNSKQEIKPSDKIAGEFSLRYTVQGAQKGTTYHSGKGIFLLAYQKGEVNITPAQKTDVSNIGALLRKAITNILDNIFPDDTIAFARALLLGDSSLLTYEEDTAFQLSGIRHVVAVSGLHVSILFSLVYTLVGKRRFLTAALGVPLLIVFAAIAGFTPSINRACIMQVLMILAMLFNREYDPPTALGFAAVVMLAINPLTITSVSFQLSVGCMIGIFLFSARISRYLLDEKRFGPAKGKTIKARITRWVVGSVSVTLSAMATTAPLCACYFGMVSLVSIFTNLLTLWVISTIFYLIMLACILGAIFLPAGKTVAWCASWLIRYVLAVSKLLSSIPLAAIYTCSVYVVIWLVFAYALFLLFLFFKEKKPFVFGVCLISSLIVCLMCAYIEPRLDNYRVTVLDVGQGQAILLQYNNRNYLVDCGGDTAEIAADAVIEELFSLGFTKLDGVIITHYDADHCQGLPLLLSRISVDKLYLPSVSDEASVRESIVSAYDKEIIWIEASKILQIDTMQITIFAPPEEKTDNENSLCILFQPEKCDILITADRNISGEMQLLQQLEDMKLELLIAGHHGADNATGIPLLSETMPEHVAISVGENNAYGHPSEKLLDRLRAFGCKIYRTDLDGKIIFRG